MSTKRSLPLFAMIVMLLNGCSGASDAPAPSADIQTWVEFPYEGDILPMGPVTFVVYASASEGISFIQIKVNGEALPAVPVTSLAGDGSSRLSRVDVPYMPSSEGEYLVEAAGVASGGGVGESGSTRFCIVTCNPGQTPTPGANATETPTPNPAETGTPAPFINNSPTPTTSAAPIVPSITLPPPVIPSITLAPPPSDTSGPSINSASVYWYPESCQLFGTAEITDPSGVVWAEFHFNLNGGGWAWIQMNQSGNTWTSQVGVSTGGALDAGSLEYKVRTLDTLNNESWSGESSKNFAYCGD